MFNQVSSDNKQRLYFWGVNSFWTILNSQHAIDALDKLNDRGKVTSVSYFDFSTFNPKIPHDKSLKVLNELKWEDGEFISSDC